MGVEAEEVKTELAMKEWYDAQNQAATKQSGCSVGDDEEEVMLDFALGCLLGICTIEIVVGLLAKVLWYI